MDYYRITSIQDSYFPKMHRLMQEVFPPEEVLEFSLWEEPIQDPGIHVYVAIANGEVVGATEYRYYPHFRTAMTDFTIIGKPGLGIGRFLLKKREKDIERIASESRTVPIGMFAEIYDPYRIEYSFGGVTPMNSYVRREVLSHIGYRKLDFSYVHPSWDHQGDAVSGLDLSFLPAEEELGSLPAELVYNFLTEYYSALPNKPQAWNDMMDGLKTKNEIALLPL
ncbi:GNAT family N-acetyltransferase [Paenibacillus sp. GCM10012307]|uniref:GNAT family N-acetyltransferase n=1 Tax=Paenibacillus roseus TaxID=2798579 RepID=A0A934MS87_9BACL|nr:GNAT family N-acetyltransferase [Paenibacillus roseus]MBJ6363668.1 GNAT family N-acetyltransferase [Paenibacillus roseus]